MRAVQIQRFLPSCDEEAADAVARLCRTAREVLGAERVSVWMLDASGQTISPFLSDSATVESPADAGREWVRTPLADVAFAQTVVNEREALVIEDAAGDGRLPAALVEGFGITSIHCEPLVAGRVVGVFTVEPAEAAQRADLHAITPLLAAEASQLRALRDAEARRAEAELLLELSEASASTHALHEVLSALCERLAAHLKVRRTSIFLLEDGRLVPRMSCYADGTSSVEEWRRFRDAEALTLPLIATVLESGQPIAAEDASSPFIAGWWADTFDLGAALAVPVASADDLLGVIVLDTSKSRRFTSEEARLAAAAGMHVARLIERSKAEERRVLHLRSESAVRRLLEEGAAAATVVEAGGVLARVLHDLLGVERSSAHILDAQGRITRSVTVGLDEHDGAELTARLEGTPTADLKVVATILSEGRPVFVEDSSVSDMLPAEHVTAYNMGAYVCLPIMSADGGLGLVACIEPHPRRWTADERKLAERLTLEGSLVVDHARLREVERQRLSDLAHQALHDPLTGLANRALFLDRLGLAGLRATRRGSGRAVLFVDLDRFKAVNDSLGHETGDMLLRATATRISGCMRPEDTVARLGGDEFVVLIEDIACEADAVRVAHRLADVMRAPFSLEGRDVLVTTSIGVAVDRDATLAATELLRHADLAMYKAKRNGRARCEVFDVAADAGTLARRELETELRVAVEEGQFALVYQPLVRLDDGHIGGMEALLRWNHPSRGVVPPLQFIPLAEDTGHILRIGRWVLEEACAQAVRWQAGRAPDDRLVVWVNLSARQLQTPDGVAVVADVLRRSGLDPRCLGLEITESVLMEDHASVTAKLTQLKTMGVNLAIDDFGTGYSSLAYLKHLPVDTLKIDKSFIAGLGNAQDHAIVRAVTMLAETLGRQVVAEGVETSSQFSETRALNCAVGQGYFFSRPLSAEDASALLEQGHCFLDEPVSGARPALTLLPKVG